MTMQLQDIFAPPAGLAQLGSGTYAWEALLGVFILAFVVLGGVASIVGLVYIWIRALKQPSLAEGLAKCGRCGYGVRGAARMACPECGSDFREVGIVSPAMRKAYISPAVFLILWSLCLWIPGCFVSGVAVAVGPQHQVVYEDVDLVPPNTSDAGYDNIMLNRSPYGIYAGTLNEILPQESRYIDVDIYGPGGNEWYEVDIIDSTYEDYSYTGSSPRPFNRAGLESWIATVGGDLKKPDVQMQIDQVYNNIQQAQARGLSGNHWSAFTVNSQSNWSEQQPARWFIVLQFVVWILIFAAGIALYFFLKRRYDQRLAKLREEANTYDPQTNDPHASPPTPQPDVQPDVQ